MARLRDDPHLLTKIDKALPLVPAIDDSFWSCNKSLSWFLKGPDGSKPSTIDKILSGTYNKPEPREAESGRRLEEHVPAVGPHPADPERVREIIRKSELLGGGE